MATHSLTCPSVNIAWTVCVQWQCTCTHQIWPCLPCHADAAVVAGTDHTVTAAAKWVAHSVSGSRQSARGSAEHCAPPAVLSADWRPAAAGQPRLPPPPLVFPCLPFLLHNLAPLLHCSVKHLLHCSAHPLLLCAVNLSCTILSTLCCTVLSMMHCFVFFCCTAGLLETHSLSSVCIGNGNVALLAVHKHFANRPS